MSAFTTTSSINTAEFKVNTVQILDMPYRKSAMCDSNTEICYNRV